MAETAFSKQFEREIDPEQYIQLLDAGTDLHAFTRSDIICPICKVGGASFVSATTGQKARKAHFRFTSDTGESAHDPLCDFYNDKLLDEVNEKLVLFSSDRTKISKVIRQRVCAGIQEGLFSQTDIWSMRCWFFDLRSKCSVPVVVPEQQVRAMNALYMLWRNNFGNSFDYPYHPLQANMPGFNWKRAIRQEFLRVNKQSIEKLIEFNYRTKLLGYLDEFVKLLDRGQMPTSCVQPEALAPTQIVTQQLTKFIQQNDPEFRGMDKSENDSLVSKFSAFAVLLLYTSGWDLTVAINKYIRIINVKQVDDMLAGNIIGFDLFKGYSRSVALLSLQSEKIRQTEFSYVGMQEIEQEMRNIYIEYSLTHPLPPLAPPLY